MISLKTGELVVYSSTNHLLIFDYALNFHSIVDLRKVTSSQGLKFNSIINSKFSNDFMIDLSGKENSSNLLWFKYKNLKDEFSLKFIQNLGYLRREYIGLSFKGIFFIEFLKIDNGNLILACLARNFYKQKSIFGLFRIFEEEKAKFLFKYSIKNLKISCPGVKEEPRFRTKNGVLWYADNGSLVIIS